MATTGKKLYIIGALLIVVAFVGLTTRGTGKEPEKNFASFVSLTTADPLFYSPFYDAEAYYAEIDDLERAETELLDISIKNIEDTGIRSELYLPVYENFTLFPYDYLRSLPDVSKATEDFLEDPSEQAAAELLTHYKTTARYYREAVERQIASLEALFTEIAPAELGYYFFVDSGTSVEIVYQDLRLVRENAQQLELEIKAREDCLAGKVDCLDLVKQVSAAQLTAAIFAEPSELDPDKLAIIKTSASYQDNIERITGPFALDSECWYTGPDGIDWTYLYVYDNSEDKEIQKVRPILAEETYYSYVPEDPVYEIQKYLRSIGAKYQNQIAGFPYQCTDLTFYPKILTADFITEAAKEKEVAPQELLETEYQLLAQNMFGVLGPAFAVIANNLDLLRDNQRLNAENIVSPQFLLATRSAYSIMYMPYAQSVWRMAKQPTYMLPRDENLIERLRKDHIRLSELMKAGYTPEEIKKFHFTQWDYMTELLERKAAESEGSE